MRVNLQKMGGVAALIHAATYVAGMMLMLTFLAPVFAEDVNPIEKVAFLADHQAVTYLWTLFIYVVASVFLVVLVLALYERLKAGRPALVQTATTFGLIWAGLVLAAGMVYKTGVGTVIDLYGKDPAQAATVWLTANSVYGGLEGGNVILGGLWTLLVSWAALRTGELPKELNYLGVVIGAAGLLTIVPVLEVAMFVFGLGGIVWFVWLGIVMLRSGKRAEA